MKLKGENIVDRFLLIKSYFTVLLKMFLPLGVIIILCHITLILKLTLHN